MGTNKDYEKSDEQTPVVRCNRLENGKVPNAKLIIIKVNISSTHSLTLRNLLRERHLRKIWKTENSYNPMYHVSCIMCCLDSRVLLKLSILKTKYLKPWCYCIASSNTDNIIIIKATVIAPQQIVYWF